jgi:hypothetical protein
MPPKASAKKPASKKAAAKQQVEDDIIDVEQEIIQPKNSKVKKTGKKVSATANMKTSRAKKAVSDSDGLDELDAEIKEEAINDAEIADLINTEEDADLEDEFPNIENIEDDMDLEDIPEPKPQTKPKIQPKETKSDRNRNDNRNDRNQRPAIERVDPSTPIGELKISRILDYIYQHGKENDNPVAMSGALTFKSRLSGNGLGPNRRRFNKNHQNHQNHHNHQNYQNQQGSQSGRSSHNSGGNNFNHKERNQNSGKGHFGAPFSGSGGRTLGAVSGRPPAPSKGELFPPGDS